MIIFIFYSFILAQVPKFVKQKEKKRKGGKNPKLMQQNRVLIINVNKEFFCFPSVKSINFPSIFENFAKFLISQIYK